MRVESELEKPQALNYMTFQEFVPNRLNVCFANELTLLAEESLI